MPPLIIFFFLSSLFVCSLFLFVDPTSFFDLTPFFSAQQSVLDSAKEDVEKVRDGLQRLSNSSLTRPSLEELCQSFHTISMVGTETKTDTDMQTDRHRQRVKYPCTQFPSFG